MATNVWLGIADAVAQSDDIQITAFDAATTYTLTIGGVEVANVTGNTSASQTATDLAADFEANKANHPYSANLTAAANTDTVTLTHGVEGTQFIVTAAVASGNGTIGNVTANTTLAGPNVWATASNWSLGTAPGGSDDVVVPAGAPPIVALPTTSQTIASLTFMAGADHVGRDSTRFSITADGNTFSATQKPEYRPVYLDVTTASIRYGVSEGATPTWQSKRHLVKNSITSAATIDVHDTPTSSADSGRGAPALRLLASDNDVDVSVRKTAGGGVGIAMDSSTETATVGDITIAGTAANASRVYTGLGVTMTSWSQSGGVNRMRAASAATPEVTANGGTLTMDGVYVVGNMTVEGEATVVDNHTASSGNSATAVVVRGGTLDLQRTALARQYGTLTHQGGDIKDDPSVTLLTHNRARSTVSA